MFMRSFLTLALVLGSLAAFTGCESTQSSRSDAVDIYRLGEREFQKGNLEECRKLLLEAYEISPDYAQLRRDLGMVNFELGKPFMFAALRHADAADRGARLIERFDNDNDGAVTRAEYDLGDIVFDLDQNGLIDEDEETMGENLFASIDFNGNGIVESGDLDSHRAADRDERTKLEPYFKEAKLHYQFAAQNRPQEPISHYNLARIYLFEGKLQTARRALEMALDTSPMGGELHEQMQLVLHQIEEQITKRQLDRRPNDLRDRGN